MAILRLSNLETAKSSIAPKLRTLTQELDKRIEIWQKIPPEKKRAWIKSDKDPIMSLAWDLYKYLDRNFFGEVRE